MGAMLVYGAYLPRHLSLLQATGIIAIADVMVAILAGLAIFPIVFSNGLETNQGAGLVFNTLPIAFGKMPFGSFFGSLFFILLVLAAWTSSISLLEPTVAWMIETKRFTRISATAWIGFFIWLFGLVTIFSFNIWSDVKPLSMFSSFANKTLFDLLDFSTSNIMLPLGGFLIVVFAAWKMREADLLEEVELSAEKFRILRFLMRYIAPLGVLVVFLNAIGVFA
jgi:NSS family neurotransmitter:Na+ symporter